MRVARVLIWKIHRIYYITKSENVKSAMRACLCVRARVCARLRVRVGSVKLRLIRLGFYPMGIDFALDTLTKKTPSGVDRVGQTPNGFAWGRYGSAAYGYWCSLGGTPEMGDNLKKESPHVKLTPKRELLT